MHKRVLTIDLKEYLFFSAGLIFETVLLDVRNKMKNVLDELYVIGLYKHRGKGGRAVGATAGPKAPAGPAGAVKPT
jgi:hypothetical protein